MPLEQLEVKRYEYWTVSLRENQSYLGWTIIEANRAGLVDLMDITDGERVELFEIGRKLKAALTELFQPDLFNWASFGNKSPQLHMQVIPRYRSDRVFMETTFADARWGENYSPYQYDLKILDATLLGIRDAIRQKLS